ncbi:MAG: hypothetical protein JSR77_18600 [Planctomycetes bacterium]|nr:hypothetical protein [Planctomycetota bacterium]
MTNKHAIHATWQWFLPFVAISAPALAQPTFQGLSSVQNGRPNTYITRVSANGQAVVGSVPTPSGSEPFRWTESTGFVSLQGPSDARYGLAWDVSADGSVVVGQTENTCMFPFRWSEQNGFEVLSSSPGIPLSGRAQGVSADGQTILIHGYFGICTTPNWHLLKWRQPGPAIELASSEYVSPPFVLSQDGGTVYAGNRKWVESADPVYLEGTQRTNTVVHAVTPEGQLAIGEYEGNAARWTELSGWQPIWMGGAAMAISNDGAMIVGMNGDNTAFCSTPRYGSVPIKGWLKTAYGLDIGNWVLRYANSVSADGTVIVGNGTNPQGQTEGWILRLPRKCPADLNEDGGVDGTDVQVFFSQWDAGC